MEKLQALYSKSHLRLFGIAFDALYAGTYHAYLGPTGIPEATILPGNRFHDVVVGSGGVFSSDTLAILGKVTSSPQND